MKTFQPHRILRQTPPERLYPTPTNRIFLEEPKPMSESLEWRLAARYWHQNGVAPFADGSVPYIINNSGWAPRAAAELVFAAGTSCVGTVIVVEIAAGSGIFARQVLDYLQQKSIALESDVYDRLIWICTDGSALSVEAWRERKQFHHHECHVRTVQCDAEDILSIDMPEGTVVGLIANYALDGLPAEVVHRNGRRLHLQACVDAEESELKRLLGVSVDEIRRLAQSKKSEDLDRLMPLLERLEVQASFEHGTVAQADAALNAAESDIAMVNVSALRVLSDAVSLFQEGGFVLINDYGSTIRDEFDRQTFVHRFGGTITCALNFPHLERWLVAQGGRVLTPKNDEQRTIHTRLAVFGKNLILDEVFHKWFSDPQYVHADRVGSWTNSYIAAGQVSEALEVFERHLQWCPTDWHKLTEAAQLLMQQFGNLSEALVLAKAATETNPWSSTLVWNVYGSILFSMGEQEQAEMAWNKALAIWSEDPSTWLNLSYLYAARGQNEHALTALAKGLVCDRGGGFRAALLQKQSEILGGQYQSHRAYADRLTRRHRTLVDAIRPSSSPIEKEL